jgi:hypothetical protein
VIANCPTCGTHYKHRPPAVKIRARCVRCDTTMFLARLRPYRIVPVVDPSPEHAAAATSHLPIGLDHPALATTIARNIARPAPTASPNRSRALRDDDPLPQIHEMGLSGAFESAVPSPAVDDILGTGGREAFDRTADGETTPDAVPPAGSAVATFALWLATGAIAGTGASWTMGGTTVSGLAAGATLGAITGWGWRRWTSPK